MMAYRWWKIVFGTGVVEIERPGPAKNSLGIVLSSVPRIVNPFVISIVFETHPIPL